MTLKTFNIIFFLFAASLMLLQSWMSFDVWSSGSSHSPQFAGIINMCLVWMIYYSAQYFTTPRYIVTKVSYRVTGVY